MHIHQSRDSSRSRNVFGMKSLLLSGGHCFVSLIDERETEFSFLNSFLEIVEVIYRRGSVQKEAWAI